LYLQSLFLVVGRDDLSAPSYCIKHMLVLGDFRRVVVAAPYMGPLQWWYFLDVVCLDD